MRGFAFALLERAIVDRDGSDGWDDLLDAVGWDGPAELIRDYDDLTFTRLLRAACSTDDDAASWRWFGEAAAPHLRSTARRRVDAGFAGTSADAGAGTGVAGRIEERYARLEMLCTGDAAPRLTWRLDTANPDLLAVSRRAATLPCWVLEGVAASTLAGEPGNAGSQLLSTYQPKCTTRGALGCLIVLDLRAADRVRA